jgi:hypothetical protein
MALNQWSYEHGGFCFAIEWCSKTCDHPKEDLAKSGYGSGMKVFL